MQWLTKLKKRNKRGEIRRTETDLQVFWHEKCIVGGMYTPVQVANFLVHEDPHGVEVDHNTAEHHQPNVQAHGDENTDEGTTPHLLCQSGQLESVPVYTFALRRRHVNIACSKLFAVEVSHDQVHHKDKYLRDWFVHVRWACVLVTTKTTNLGIR